MSAEGCHVLLVEDDVDVRETTALLLTRHGFHVGTAVDGVEGERALREGSFDVAVVDVAMPRMDGLTLTRRVREWSDVPILLLTARDLPGDVVSGLDAGADDHVAKPYDGEVLAARVRALARRPARRGVVEEVGDVVVDRGARTVVRGGAPVSLSSTEFRLLELLLDHRGAAIERAEALRRVWGDEQWTDARVVDTNVKRLRGKLGDDVIETVRGFGYRLVDVGGRG
ncbi:two-component system response regulator CseB [Luteimicrobium xylanilyticum]|uniref:Transcription factor SKN7 n=1 Tax=Luteimicrobium xylanilyticum TaxID=1133546 RepID=A0A5P9Q6I9_9MICO|nr:response regulator transcription factor [Luteimicrobium xylanilyticum]QFU97017.1 Transcription factor SKN7 [Luteimicrobium xylanilyticum]